MSDEYPADLYALVHRGTPGDLDWYREQCAGATRVLELGCGYGRVLEALAEPSRTLVGVDLHAGMLQRARARIDAGTRLIEADIRDVDVGERFERVLIPHSGLYCLLSDEDVKACLRNARRHLEPDGRLLIDAYVADTFHLLWSEDDDEDALTALVTVDDGAQVWDVSERCTWDPHTHRIDATYVHAPRGGGPSVEGRIAQRYLLRPQIRALVAASGFEILSLEDGFDGDPYADDGDVWSLVAAPASNNA